MQRLATRQSRAANTQEKLHMAWIKERGVCAACGIKCHVINHHCEGSTFKIKVMGVTVLIGHAFVIGLCSCCDALVTNQGRRQFREAYGLQSDLWLTQYEESPVRFDSDIETGIAICGK